MCVCVCVCVCKDKTIVRGRRGMSVGGSEFIVFGGFFLL